MIRTLFGFLAGIALAYIAARHSDSNPTAEDMARKVDRALDREKLVEITEYDLVNRWPLEIAPFFEYEMLTNGEAKAPKVEMFQAPGCMQYFHVMGFTFTFDDSGKVFLNGRFGNDVSPKKNSIAALTTLVHETAHIQKGDFSMDEDAEKNAQLATLEVLAAMANSGNKAARQALLDELRDIYTGVACLKAIKSGDFDTYYRFMRSLFGDDRGERSIRKWKQRGLGKLEEILTKYSVTVYDDMQDFQFIAKADGDKSPRIFLLDDLQAFLKNL